jgi:hypothetical protein
MSEAETSKTPAPAAAAPTSPGAATGKGERPGAAPAREALKVDWQPMVGIAMLAGIAIVANNWLNQGIERTLDPPKAKPVVQWAVGQEADLAITLITADMGRLSCASDTVVDGVHCAFDGNKRRWPRAPDAPLDDNNADIIQPYRTADTNQLVYVSGLWAQPELAMRVHREPPDSVPTDKLLRFVAYCRARFVGELKQAGTRWDNAAAWQGDATALVAKPLSCTLKSPAWDEEKKNEG